MEGAAESHTILVVDDEPAIRESLTYALRQDGFHVVAADSLRAAREAMAQADLLVLDLMLPDGNGLELLRQVGSRSKLPVIVLTSRDTEVDKVVGLELGADDYVVKPFSPRELVARVRAVLRRLQPPAAADMDLLQGPSGVGLDLGRRDARVGGRRLALSKTEFDLLALLVKSPGRVLTREQLLDRVWGPGCAVTDRTVDTHVKALRRKLAEAGGDPRLIETVRGVGYRLAEDLG